MKKSMKLLIAALLAVAGSGLAVKARAGTRASTARDIVAAWPEESRQAAEALIDKYGGPDTALADQLQWNYRRPFLKIIAHASPNKFRAVEETVRVDVPRHHNGVVGFKDCLVQPDRVNGQMTAFCDSEAGNIQALNLAHDVLTGNKDISQARTDQEQGARLHESGKTTAETDQLNFRVNDPTGWVYEEGNNGNEYISLYK